MTVVIRATTAGEASGSIVSTFEADDFAAHGKVMDAFFASGGTEFMQAISGEDSPIASWQSSTYVEVRLNGRACDAMRS